MRKNFSLIALLILGTVIWYGRDDIKLLFKTSTAYAVGDLTVNWGVPDGTPLFTVQNLTPGQSQSRSVTIQNGSSNNHPVAIRGILNSQTGNLASVLLITISENGTDKYGGSSSTGPKTLQQFFTDSALPNGIFVSTLPSANSTIYSMKITFDPSAGNAFQNKQLLFDIHIGIFFDLPQACNGINLNGKEPIYGTQKNDILHGTSGNDLILGLEGNDIIYGGGGDDCILGGQGNDILRGEAGNDTLIGENGNDILIGGIGNDTILGGMGKDILHGEDGNDILHGNEEKDLISGGNGNDQLFGEENDDILNGENGNDFLDGGVGQDITNGSAGIDTCLGETKSGCEL